MCDWLLTSRIAWNGCACGFSRAKTMSNSQFGCSLQAMGMLIIRLELHSRWSMNEPGTSFCWRKVKTSPRLLTASSYQKDPNLRPNPKPAHLPTRLIITVLTCDTFWDRRDTPFWRPEGLVRPLGAKPEARKTFWPAGDSR